MKNVVTFEELMQAHQPLVLGTAVRLLRNKSDAEDISQEVFLRAYERFDTLQRSPTVGAWLRTVTRNLCLNHLSRYRARWCFFSEMGNEDDGNNSGPDFPVSDSARTRLDETERRQWLQTALGKLPASQRVPLVLYHLEEHSYAEITARLGVSLTKLKMDLHRGRKALRKKLKLDGGSENNATFEVDIAWHQPRP
jgi:RNA polymerase sigma-70 factor (ECF subfamily)